MSHGMAGEVLRIRHEWVEALNPPTIGKTFKTMTAAEDLARALAWRHWLALEARRELVAAGWATVAQDALAGMLRDLEAKS